MKKCYLLFCMLLLLGERGFAYSAELRINLLLARAAPLSGPTVPKPLEAAPPGRSALPDNALTHFIVNPVAVTGQVKDERGQGFPGVNIIVKGTSSGTTTDVNGRYALEVADENAILVFSFVGYIQQEVSVGGRTVIDVQLEPNLHALE